MRKSLSCTRDLLLAFPRIRRTSVPSVIPSLSSESRCQCHTVAVQSVDTRSSSRQAARSYIAQDPSATRTTQPPALTEDSGRVASNAQPGKMLDGASSLQKGIPAVVAEIKLRPSEAHGPEPGSQSVNLLERNEDSTRTASSGSPQRAKAVDHIDILDESSNTHDLDCDQSLTHPHITIRKPISHLLRRHPHIKQALRERKFRWAVSEILRHPELRKKEALLSQVRKATWEHANGGQSHRGDFMRLKTKPGKRRTLKDFGLTDLAARLGMPPAGYQRGPHWEHVHRTEVWGRGRLPSEGEVLKALQLDINLGLMPRVGVSARKPRCRQDSLALPFDRERERQEINRKLSAYVRSGAISAGSHTRPGKVQVSRLFALIEQYRQRGFRPNKVTANIAVKCWLRSLQARQADGSRLKDSEGYNRPDAERILGHVIDDESLNRYIDSSDSTGEVQHWDDDTSSMPGPTSTARPTLLYDKHVKPLGMLLIKTSRARGDWQAAKRILRWLAIFRARCRTDEVDQQ